MLEDTRRSFLIGLAVSASIACVADADAAPPDDAGSVEDDFLRQARAITALSLLASRRAAPQLTVPKLKRFADLEIAAQERLWAAHDFLNASERSGDDRPPSDPELERYLVPRGRTMIATIRSTDAGTNLARAYFLLEVDIHQQLLRLQEDYLKLGKDTHLLQQAKRVDAMAREHLRLLEEIKADTDSGKGMVQPGR